MSLMYRASDASTFGDFCACLTEGLPCDAYNLRGHWELPRTLEIALAGRLAGDVHGERIQGVYGRSRGEKPEPATAFSG